MDDSDRTGDFTKPLEYSDVPPRERQNVIQAVINRQIDRFKGLVPAVFQRAAEDKLVEKQVLEEMSCTLPDSPRSTFLMVFSPDGKKVASTHGNHNVYVTDLTTGKNIQTLSGHPRTPWCIAFHPSSNQILATGCLGGQVRVWDLTGGSEVWTAESQTVIASLAFHPIDRMLVIATYNELHFWDWSQPEPFAKCSTKTDREKVRYVTFDRLGNKLITGIANPVAVQSQWDRVSTHVPTTTSNTAVTSMASGTPPVAVVAPTSERERSIAFCYRNLMNQYNQLVRRYFDLSRSRVTPTMDRGTDPMDMMDMQNLPSTSGTPPAIPRAPSTGIADPDAESTSSGSGSEASTPVSSVAATTESNFTISWDRPTTTSTGSGNHVNPFTTVSRGDTTTPTYSWIRSVVSPREVARDPTSREPGPYSTDLLRALLRDVASSESQSSEDTELEMASRSDSPRVVVSRADSDHPRPVPTFQLRPRLLQDPSYQLRFLTNRETFGSISNVPPSSRRMLMRPGGQFVLSRHSNSPFQPRVPLRVDGPPVTQPPTTAPAIPSQTSSFSPARRLLYDQVRVFLCDRIRSATEPSSADTTTNYSRLAREPDADPWPDISWDSETETVIIRTRGCPRPQRSSEEGVNRETSTTSENAGSSTVTTATESLPVPGSSTASTSTMRSSIPDVPPSVRHRIEVLSSRIESMQRLVRARIEVLQMQNMRSAWRNVCDEIRSMPLETAEAGAGPSTSSETSENQSGSSAGTQPTTSANRDDPRTVLEDGSFERHLRGQVRRLRAVVHELRGGIEGVVRGRDVSSLLQSASLEDRPAPSPALVSPTPPPLPPRPTPSVHPSLLPDYQKLATALARDMMKGPENWQPQPGPSSAPGNGPSVDESMQKRLMNQLKAVVLKVALRRLEFERGPESSEPQPGPSRLATEPSPPPLPPRAPVIPRGPRLAVRLTRLQTPSRRAGGGAEATLRADGFHREQLSGWRAMAARLSSSEDRRYHRNKLRGAHRDNAILRSRVKRTVRAMLRGRGHVGLQDLFDRGLLGLTPEGICLRYPTGEDNRRSTAPDSLLRTERSRSSNTGNGPDTCRSCGLRKQSGSSLKRKGANPQRFRADKFARDGNGDRRPPDVTATRIGMLQSMIDRMQSIVRMQREAQPAECPLTMTSEERALVSEIDEEVRRIGLPIQLHCTPTLLRTFRRNVAQLRAHQLLNSMVHSVSAFFEGNATHVVDREIMKLYNLLQLALELTDLILEQLQNSRGLSATESPDTRVSEADTVITAPSFTPASTRVDFAPTEVVTTTNSTYQPSPCAPSQTTPIATTRSSASSQNHSEEPRNSIYRRLPFTRVSYPRVPCPGRLYLANVRNDNPDRTEFSDPTSSNNHGHGQRPFRSSFETYNFNDRSPFQPRVPATPPAHDSGSLSRHYSLIGFYSNDGSRSSGGETSRDAPTTSSVTPTSENRPVVEASVPVGSSSSEGPSPSAPPSSRTWGSDMRRFHSRDRARIFDRLIDAQRRRQSLSSHSQGETSQDQESPRSGRAAAMHRYRRPRLWPVARMSTGGHIIGCLRRQRHVRFGSIRTRMFARSIGDEEQEFGRNTAAGPSEPPALPPLPQLPTLQRGVQWLPSSRNQWGPEGPPPLPPPAWVEPTSWVEPTPIQPPPSESSFTVPMVRVNDVPISDTSTLNCPRTRTAPRNVLGDEMSRWRYYRPRFLHPRYFGPNPFDEQDADNADQPPPFYRMLNASSGHSGSVYTLDPIMITEAPLSPHHRIQAWDFSHHIIPDISNRELNGVVGECKIHNDASVDVSSNGQLLVTLLPSSGRPSVTTMLGVYSLEWSTLGQLLYKTGFDQNAVSVSLSPTARHLLVGLASRPLALRDRDRTNMAQIFRLGGAHALPAGSWHSGRGVLQPVRDLEQTREMNVMSVNCIRWAPGPGHGLVYGTNTGQLKILR